MILPVYLHVCLVCVAVLSQSAGQGAPPRDTGHYTRVLYQKNRSVNLTCRFPSSGDVTVTWRKTGLQIPIAVGSSVISHPDKYQIQQETSQGWSILFIDATSVTDAGYYTCSWMMNRTVVNSTTFMLVRKEKHFTLIGTSEKTVKASIGDDVELPCVVQRKHKYKVLWLDPRNRVVTFGSQSLRKRYTISSKGHRRNWTLKITKVNQNDFGTLTCLVNTDPVLSSTIVLSRKAYPSQRHTTTTTTTTTIKRYDGRSNVTDDMCGNTTSNCRSVSDPSAEPGSDDVPKVAAVHQAKTEQSWDRLILGTSIGVCGFVLFVGLASGCFLVDRIQKMTRRIIQQELTLDHMRMRRRSRRLTSETHVIIDRQNSSPKDNTNDSYNSGNAKIDKSGNSLKVKNDRRFNDTYCEPWSSSSDIIQAMNAAYTNRQGREDVQPRHVTDADPTDPTVGTAEKGRQEPLRGGNPCPVGQEDHVTAMEEPPRGDNHSPDGQDDHVTGMEEPPRGDNHSPDGQDDHVTGMEESSRGDNHSPDGQADHVTGMEESSRGDNHNPDGQDNLVTGMEEPPRGDNHNPDGQDNHVTGMEEPPLVRVDGEGQCEEERASWDM